MILNDKQIKERCEGNPYQMITPFVDHQVSYEDNRKLISYGLSSFGYDIRLGYDFMFCNHRELKPGDRLDPKKSDEFPWFKHTCKQGETISIPPNGFLLGVSLEFFEMYNDCIGLVTNKSTYARTGIQLSTTVLEPRWRGWLTLEIYNPTNYDVILYPGEGITQVLFIKGDVPLVHYDMRGGKYQDQDDKPVPSKV